jgi:hypothetical protein
MDRSFQVLDCGAGLNREKEAVTSQPHTRFVRAQCKHYDACTLDGEESETDRLMPSRTVLGLPETRFPLGGFPARLMDLRLIGKRKTVGHDHHRYSHVTDSHFFGRRLQ